MNNQVSLTTLVDIDNVAIRFNEFVVNVTPVKRELSLASRKTPYKSGILPAAYACSLARFFKTINQLEGIKIYADRPFNSTISTQTDLADFFDVVVLTNEESSQKTERFDLKTYLDKKAQVPDHLLLVLKKSPEKTDVFKFTVELTLTDSVVNKFDFALSPVEIIAE